MERVTPEERARFHKILDESIDKMNSPKNAKKNHWSYLRIKTLQKMVNVENSELDLALESVINYYKEKRIIESENFDLINLNIMIIDNLRGNK